MSTLFSCRKRAFLSRRRPEATRFEPRKFAACRGITGEQLLSINPLTLELIPGLILLMVQKRNLDGLHSGSLAKAVGLSPDTIRHYERVGVLPRASRTSAGYRVYPASSVERVLLVQRALRIGFTLP